MTAFTPEQKAAFAIIEEMKASILELGPITLAEMNAQVRELAFDIEWKEMSAVARGFQKSPNVDAIHTVLKLDRLGTFLDVCEKRPADAAKRLYAVAERQ